ncbi:WPE palindromic element domain-containing protein [Wolbachia endosymbiont (group A) of Barypeithes pellucidus]|nr:WPE palindromic element domain-containing protein [Wolbachia endosymbiont (group A) of Apoderus coryli]
MNPQLYEHCDLRTISARKGVIPVPRHWDPGNLIASNALGLVSMGFAL